MRHQRKWHLFKTYQSAHSRCTSWVICVEYSFHEQNFRNSYYLLQYSMETLIACLPELCFGSNSYHLHSNFLSKMHCSLEYDEVIEAFFRVWFRILFVSHVQEALLLSAKQRFFLIQLVSFRDLEGDSLHLRRMRLDLKQYLNCKKE